MLQFIFSNLFMLALGAILFIFVRALPRLEKGEGIRQGYIERWITSDLPEKVDTTLNSFLVKFLRKSKIFILRIDNLVGDRLKKMKIVEDFQAAKPDYKEIISSNVGDESPAEETKNQA